MKLLPALGGATATMAAVAGTAQVARYWSTSRRITWSPGAGRSHDGSLHARVAGTGADGVLLVHGLGGTNSYWGGPYDRVAGVNRLVVPDLLGFGASPRPNVAYDAADHVAALIATLDELVVTEPVVIGAHSVGCLVALALAQRHPHRVSAIVAICPPLYENPGAARERIARLGWIERQLAYDTPTAATMCRLVCEHRRAAAALTAVARPGLPAVVRRDGVQHSWASYSRTFRNLLASAEGDQWLADASCPVTLIAGTEDGITDLDHLTTLTTRLTHVTLEIQPGADHSLPLTHPDTCTTAIARALDPSPQPPGRRLRRHARGEEAGCVSAADHRCGDP